MRRSPTTRHARLVLWLLSDLSARDLHYLGKGSELYTGCFWVEDNTAFIPDTHDVPWFVALLLASYNKKHILQSRKLPCLDTVAREVTQFTDKLEWKYVHRN